jgi:hypothetical protein
MHAAWMFSRVRNHFRGSRLARMSSGDYCLIRDLGLVKGGKGLRHHEVILSVSWKGAVQCMKTVLRSAPEGFSRTSESVGKS